VTRLQLSRIPLRSQKNLYGSQVLILIAEACWLLPKVGKSIVAHQAGELALCQG